VVGLTVFLVVTCAPWAGAASEPPAAHPGAVVGSAAAAAAPPAEPKVAAPQPPVQISADAAEYFNKDGLVVFTGSVVAAQGDTTISSDRMEVAFEQSAAGAGTPAEKPAAKSSSSIGSPSTAQRITTIVALGNVKFRQLDPESKKERYATGDKGVYDVDKHLITLTGNPRLWEGKNVIVGEEMVFHLDDKKVVIIGGKDRKVNLTVYPDELKEGKKP
jgi:lipopolysaccharide export system protein LptA